MTIRMICVLCVLVLIASCRQSQRPHDVYQKTAYSTEGMVVSVHPLASGAGTEILNEGGNAIDAAVAVHLALAVVYPRAGNLGGGGFLVYRSGDGDIAALDFREKAPRAAHRDMYLDSLGNVISGLSTEGHLAVGVPGSVAGLFAAHQKYGTLPWVRLFVPAIRFAADGHALTHFEAKRLNAFRERFLQFNDPSMPFLARSEWHAGDRLRQKALAATLTRIAESGPNDFYQGYTADLIISEIESGGGILTHDDLRAYTPKWRTPITADYRGHRVISMPPPSSGGIALAQLLGMASQHPLGAWGHRDMRTVHMMAEAERRVFADRARYLGDTDFYPVPIDTLLRADYITDQMQDFSLLKATKSQHVGVSDVIESFETTHLSIVDRDGNAVAMTITLNTSYGSRVYVDGAGFFLNNEMDDFSLKPGVPNYYGLVGAEANAIAPGKRMLSSMTPTIVEKEGRFFMSVGSPGGSTIITSVFQVVLNVIEFGMTGSQAVSALRFHHQWLPDEIIYEPGCFAPDLMTALSQMGHQLREVEEIGTVEVILAWPDGRLEGAADPRESSHAEGL